MSNILLKELNVDGIPVLEYIPLNTDIKGLIFVQHGYTSDKSTGAHFFSYPLAKKGYKIVSVDAYMHGDRVSEPFISGNDIDRRNTLFDVVDQTAKDIQHLYEIQYSKEFSSFDFIDLSIF